MAGRIQGITIEIDGNTTKLEQSLKGVDSQLKNTKSNLKDINKLLKLNPGNVELLTQKQKNLKTAVADTKKRLEELKKAQKGVAKGSEEWDRLQREIIATKGDLKNLQKELRSFGNVSSQVLKAAGKSMKDFGGKVSEAGKKLQPLSTAATGVLTALAGLAYKSVQTADDLNTLSKQTGFTTDEIQKMKYAADLVDVSFEAISGALRKLKPQITDDNEALNKLGVSTKNVDGSTRNATEVFYDAIKALSKIPNETERDQLAMDLFGKSADDLAGIIDDGGESLIAYGKQAEELGLIMSGDTLDSLNDVNDTIDTLKAQGGAALAELGATFAKVFAPALETIIPIVKKVTDAIANLTPEQAELIVKITAVVAAIGPVLTIGGKLISGIGSIISVLGTVVGVLGGPLTIAIGAVVAAGVLLYKNWDTVKAYAIKLRDGIKAAWLSIKAWTEGAWNKIKIATTTAWNAVKTTITGVWNTVKTAVSNAVSAVKNAVSNAWTSIKDTASTKLNAVKTVVTGAWNSVKTAVSGKINEIKNNISNGWTTMQNTIRQKGFKGAISDAFGNVKNIIGEKMNEAINKLKSKVGELKSYFNFDSLGNAFNTVKNSIDNFIKKMKDLASTIAQKISEIKDKFKFNWSLPLIKLPHFKIKGGVAPYGLFGKGSLPNISVDWYRKAYDNPIMFTSPTVLATNQGYKGFGDGTGAEIVMGLNKLRELVGASQPLVVNVYGAAGQNVSELAAAVEQRLIAMNKQRRLASA